jgi:hypothetical protein
MENAKSYQISTSVNDGILEINVTGDVTGRNIADIQKAVDELRIEKGDIVLLDVRAVSKGKSYTDTLYYLKRPENATGKTAILDLPENEFVKPYFERLSYGTSLKVKWFCDIDEAKDWLKFGENKTIKLKFD